MTTSGSSPAPRAGALGVVFRILVAASITTYLLWKVHPADVLKAAAGANWWLIGGVALLVLVDRALMAYRWIALLCTIEPWQRPSMGAVLRIFFVSTFLGTFLPASIGGDAVRSYRMRQMNVDGADAVASVLMDRMLGVASVLIMAVVGLVLARELATDTAILAGLVFSGSLCLATMAVIFSRRAGDAAATLAGLVPLGIVHRLTTRIVEALRKYSGHPGPLLKVLAGSVVVQILRIVQAYYLGRALNIDAPLTVYFAFIPLILLVMLLPVTFNGIGTGQAAFIWAFGQAGVPDAASFALSVLFIGLGIIGNLPGALLYLTGGAGSGGTAEVRPDRPDLHSRGGY